MWKKTLGTILCVAVTTMGCASASRRAVAPAPSAPSQDSAVLADYVQRIAAGSRIRVERSSGEVLRGTLMTATADRIVVQENTRVPETPVAIPLADIARVTLDANSSSSIGRSIGIGIASGVGATLGVIGILAAMWSD